MTVQFSFIPYLYDKFRFSSGQYPLIISAPHAAQIGTKIEKELHYSDFAVKPLIEIIEKKAPFQFYILKNQLSRKIVDMNRFESRNLDEDDDNDRLFRQFLRFLCTYLQNTYEKIPYVIDLHSYPLKTPTWCEYDIVLLIQTKIGQSTDKGLINLTKSFFAKYKYKVGIFEGAERNDIVIELKKQNFAEPILFEVNESFIESGGLDEFANIFIKYLLAVNELNKIKIHEPQLISQLNDSGVHSVEFDYSDDYIEKELANLHNKPINESLKKTYVEYLNLLKSKSTKNTNDLYKLDINPKESLDSFMNIAELGQNIGDLSDYGNNWFSIIENVIIALSNQHDTILIPYELIYLTMKMQYNIINKEHYREWGMTEKALQMIVNNIHERFKHSYRPIFQEDIYKQNRSMFKTYETSNNRGYINFLIYLENKNNISEDGLKRDLETLSALFDLDIEPENFQLNNIEKMIKNTIA